MDLSGSENQTQEQDRILYFDINIESVRWQMFSYLV